MQKIKTIFKNSNFQIITLLILILLPIDFLLFSLRGTAAEFYGSTQYIQFVTQYPASLGDVRLEPLYIVMSYLIWKITNLPLPTIFAASRYLIWAAEIMVLYLIFKQITKSTLLSILGTLIFNFSFTQFSIANNLYRNHTANLFVFLIILSVLKFFASKKPNFTKYSLITGILLGLTTYTHLFMAAVIFATFVLAILILWLGKVLSKKFADTLPAFTFRFLIYSVLIGFVISSLYLVRTGHFYQFLIKNLLAGRGPWQLYITQTPIPAQIPKMINNFELDFLHQIIRLLFTLFKFLFEFKQISFPILFFGLIFISIIYVVGKIKSPSAFFILAFWLVNYFGAKLEFFGVSVVSTRFTSISFYPSLFLLVFLAAAIFLKIKNAIAKVGLALIIFSVFLAHNLPNILETTIMVNSDQLRKRDELTAQVVKEAGINIEPGTVVFSFATGLPNLRNDLILGYPVEFFSTDNVLAALELAKPYKTKYFLFDANIKAVKSSDSGGWIYLDFEKFKNPDYFELLSQKENSFANVFLYRIKNIEEKTIIREESQDKFFVKNKEQFEKIDNILASKKIIKWEVLVNLSEGANLVTEKIFFNNGQKISLGYPADDLYQFKNEKFKNKLVLNLPEISLRNSQDKIRLGFFLPGAIAHLPSSQFKANFSYLAEFSYDHYFVETELKPKDLKDFSLDFINRSQFRIIVRGLVTLLGGLIFGVILFSTFYKEKGFTFWGFSKKDRRWSFVLSIFVVLLILDGIFLSTFFVEFYKNFLDKFLS